MSKGANRCAELIGNDYVLMQRTHFVSLSSAVLCVTSSLVGASCFPRFVSFSGDDILGVIQLFCDVTFDFGVLTGLFDFFMTNGEHCFFFYVKSFLIYRMVLSKGIFEDKPKYPTDVDGACIQLSSKSYMYISYRLYIFLFKQIKMIKSKLKT